MGPGIAEGSRKKGDNGHFRLRCDLHFQFPLHDRSAENHPSLLPAEPFDGGDARRVETDGKTRGIVGAPGVMGDEDEAGFPRREEGRQDEFPGLGTVGGQLRPLDARHGDAGDCGQLPYDVFDPSTGNEEADPAGRIHPERPGKGDQLPHNRRRSSLRHLRDDGDLFAHREFSFFHP